MRAIDADALQLAIVEEGQANKRKKYIIGDIWELTGAEIREVINSQPTIQPDNNSENPNGSDAISRQAAIDALKQQADTMGRWSERYAEQRKGILTAVNIVEDLPPAQPEIIRCKDCKYWDTTWQNDYAPNYHYCPMIDGAHRNDFYCAYAERRTDE